MNIDDHHSQLAPLAHTTLSLGGTATRMELGDFARVTSALRRYDNRKDVIKLRAGDAITVTLDDTLFKGQAEADLMNTVCFDAFTPGNHEFDDGDAGLKNFLDHLRSGDCQTAAQAANVKPTAGTPLAAKPPIALARGSVGRGTAADDSHQQVITKAGVLLP